MTAVLVAGATGMLGSRIARHLLDQDGVELRLLVRDGWQVDPAKRNRIQPLVTRGATVVTGDVLHPQTLEAVTTGVDVVVSALQGQDDVIVGGQIALAEAAVRSGVRRFIPSDYAIDLFRAPAGAPQFEARKQADTAIDGMDLEVLHVLNGGFMDQMIDPNRPGLVDVAKGLVQFWGSGDEVFDLTTVDDTAAFTARLATDSSAEPGVHAISGSPVSFNLITTEVARAAGVVLRPTSWGSIDQLHAVVASKGGAGAWAAAMEWYFVGMLNTPRLADLENDRYHDARPLTLREYLERTYKPS